MYSSYNSNVKCVDLTIKFIGFEPIHYAIKLDVVSSSMIFNDFDYMFHRCIKFESIKLFFFSK